VSLAGTTVSRATLHNWEELQRKDIRIGDTVVVAKGGDIIPKVLRVVIGRRTGAERLVPVPSQCPVCGSPTERHEDEVAIRCSNRYCPAVTAGRLRHFAGREACDIEGLGERWIDLFLEQELVAGPADLFRLEASRLAVLPGWGERSAEKLIAAIARAMERPWANRIFALGIPNVGIATARTLARRYHSLEELRHATVEELAELPDIGEVVGRGVVEFLQRADTVQLLTSLAEVGFFKEREESSGEPAADTTLSGRIYVLTGTLSSLTRAEAKRALEERGARVTGSVSKQTDAVIAGENPGSKLDKARRLGIAVLDEAALRELIGGGGKGDAR
jgi:DNA ligase (NAD+)